MSTIKNNQLIAEFMGYEYIPYSGNFPTRKPGWWKKGTYSEKLTKVNSNNMLCRRHVQLKYNCSWDWLMPVVEKIESLNYEVSIGSGSFCKVDEIEVKSETKLLAAYIAVISFIILFNELPQNG